jgi:carbonic anhydrase
MDTRLTELLPLALDIKNGDVHLIKNAGAIIPDPFGTTMRSLLISVYLLGSEEIFVIGHKDCGVQGMDSSKFMGKMLAAGISQEKIDLVESCGISIENWLKGFDDLYGSVRDTVKMVRNHPLMPASVDVHGFVIDPNTGEIEEV